MESSPAQGLLGALPYEIRVEICEFLCDHCTVGWVAQPPAAIPPLIGSQPLKNLCLTSSAMREAARPILHHLFCARLEPGSLKPPRGVRPLLASIWDKPELAQQVKSLSLKSLCQNGWNFFDVSNTLFSALYYQFDVTMLLHIASGIEELEIKDIGEWVPEGTIDLPNLRELSLCRYSGGAELDSVTISALLLNKPRLRTLTLLGYDSVNESISRAVLHVQELHIIRYARHRGSRVLDIRQLVQAMPQLSTFSFILEEYPYGAFDIEASDIIDQLIVRRGTLKSLKLCGCNFSGEPRALRRFSRLETLDLVIPGKTDRQVFSALQFPFTLRKLTLATWFARVEEFARTLETIGTNLARFKNLHTVYAIVYAWLDDEEDILSEIMKQSIIDRFANSKTRLVGNVQPVNEQLTLQTRYWGENIAVVDREYEECY